MFLLQLAVILFFTKVAAFLVKKISLPSVMGEVLAGVVLGPSILGIIQYTEVLSHMAEIGVILLMFAAGLETDVNELKECGNTSILTALGGVVLPFVGGSAAAYFFGSNLYESIFIGTILTATSVSITVQTLFEMGKLKSREGLTILGAAVLDDILGIIILTLIAGVAVGETSIMLLLIKITAFFFLCWLIYRWQLVKRMAKIITRLRLQEGLLSFTIIVIFTFAYISEKSGVAAIIGSYIVGIMFGQTPYKERVLKSIQPFSISLFIPIFFATIGIRAELEHFSATIGFAITIIGVAILSKILGCGLGAKMTGMDLMASIRVGVGMIPRAEVALIVASIGLKNGIISSPTFSSAVAMVLITTIITPIMLKYSFAVGNETRLIKS